MFYEDDINTLKQYFNCQKDICLKSELFGNDYEGHGGKVLMLFAEIFSFFVEIYDIEKTTSIILKYQNSQSFKHWFWKVKHNLGLLINSDPSFYDIGKWIGSGLFLKIAISIIVTNKLYIDKTLIEKMIDKQRDNIKKLKEMPQSFHDVDCCLHETIDGYQLLKERTVLEFQSELFFRENII